MKSFHSTRLTSLGVFFFFKAACGRTRRGQRGRGVSPRLQQDLADRRGDQHQLHGNVIETCSSHASQTHSAAAVSSRVCTSRPLSWRRRATWWPPRPSTSPSPTLITLRGGTTSSTWLASPQNLRYACVQRWTRTQASRKKKNYLFFYL